MPLYGFGPARLAITEEALDEASRRERERVEAELARLQAMEFNPRPKNVEPLIRDIPLQGLNPSGYRTPELDNFRRQPEGGAVGGTGGPEEPPLPEGLEFVDEPPVVQAAEELPPLPEGLEEVKHPAPEGVDPAAWERFVKDPLAPLDPSLADFDKAQLFQKQREEAAAQLEASRDAPRPKINLSSTFGWEIDQPEWMEDAARLLEQGSDSLIGMMRDPDQDNKSDIVREAANVFTTAPTAMLPTLFRDPAQFVSDIDPFHQLGRASNAFGAAAGDLARGDIEGAKEEGASFLTEGSAGALGLFGFKGAPKAIGDGLSAPFRTIERMLPGGADRALNRAAKPVLERDAGTLAGILVDGKPVRSQALDAIVRVLERSDIPIDRIVAGLGRVVSVAKEAAGRPATIGQLLQREFGKEFPKVVDHINTVIRERGLSKTKSDASPTIVRDMAQEMRGSQAAFIEDSAHRNLDPDMRVRLPETFLPESVNRNFGTATRERMPDAFLSDSANRHFGSQARIDTLDQAAANRKIIGEEGYEPILRQRISDNRAEEIVGVLLGPHMEELTRPLRQIAAGEGKNLDNMIANQPLRAAHWMQHKARLLAEKADNAGDTPLAGAYSKMRGRVLDLIDDLKHPDVPEYTYQHARQEFGDEIGREIATGFGNRFLSKVTDPLAADQLKRAYAELSPAEQKAALESVRDTILKQLNMGRPGAGPDAILSRPAVLQQLENVFGEPGKGFANDVRKLISHDQAFRFGDQFLSRAVDELSAREMKEAYAAMSPPDKQVAMQSVRDAIVRQLNTAKPGAAPQGALARPAVLQQLEDVFGEPGKAFARDVRQRLSHEEAQKFGERFITGAANDFTSQELKEAFEAMSPADKTVAMQSARDSIIASAVNLARPGGGANMAIVGKNGVLYQLENVFGARGAAMADDIRALVGDIDPSTGAPVKPGHLGENEFLNATTNYRQSATQPNLAAAEEGPKLYASNVANSMPATMGADAAMMLSGLSSAPLLTALRFGKWAPKMLMPKRETLEDMTRVLTARQLAEGRVAAGTPRRPGPGGAVPQGGAPPIGGAGVGVGEPVLTQAEIAELLRDPELQPTAAPGGVAEALVERKVGPQRRGEPAERAAELGEDLDDPEYTAVINRDGSVTRVLSSLLASNKGVRPTAPAEPRRLRTFLRSIGGLKEEGGSISQMADVGGTTGRVDSIFNNRGGTHPDIARVKAWEEGYFPGQEPPELDEFLNAVADDYGDASPRYRLQDTDELQRWKDHTESERRLERTQNEIPFPDEAGAPLFGFGRNAAGGAASGGIAGGILPADFDRDGETSPLERAIAISMGVIGGGAAGHMSRNRNPAMAGVDRQALGDWGIDEKLPWVRRMNEEGFTPREIQLAQRVMMERYAGRPVEKIAEALQLPVDSLKAKIGDMQRRLTRAGIGVDLNRAKVSADGAPPARSPRVSAEQLKPVDLVTGYNDGDKALGIGLDLDLPENANIARVIYNRQNALRREAREAKAAGRVEQLAREWNVTPDEIEKFVAKRQVGEETVRELVEMAEKAVSQGRRPDASRMAQKLSMTPGSVKAILSQVRNGTRKVSDELRARVEAVGFKRGRPVEQSLIPSGRGKGAMADFGLAVAGGTIGDNVAQDWDDNGKVDWYERAASTALGAFAGPGLRRLKFDKRGGDADDMSFMPRAFDQADDRIEELMQVYDEDASTASLRQIQEAAVKAGKVPPVFKTFRLPDGRVIAWDGQKFSHAEAREILELGDQRLEHGQFKWGDDLSQTNWYETSGQGPRPRSLESMMKKGTAEGRDPNDILLDATPDEVMRDLRAIGAKGPGSSMQDYSYRRKLATQEDVFNDARGSEFSAADAAGSKVELSFSGAPPNNANVNLFINGETSTGSNRLTLPEAKQTFEKAFAVLERQAIQRGKDAYIFNGASKSHDRLYAGALQRLGAPQGYVAILNQSSGDFALVRARHLDDLIAQGKVDPSQFTIIPSKRGDKEVPDWRRVTGLFGFPAAAAGATLANPENESARQ